MTELERKIEEAKYQMIYYRIQRDLAMEVARLRKSVGEKPIDYPAKARYYNRLLRQAIKDYTLLTAKESVS